MRLIKAVKGIAKEGDYPRQIAIADIHGCKKTFKALLKKVELKKEDNLFLLGDYINKGPDSKGVVDYIFKLKEQGYEISTLMGNHERMLLNALKGKEEKTFLDKGGDATLESFEVKKVTQIPEKYLRFFKNLNFYIETETCFLVHAGFDFSSNKPFEKKDAMLNTRDLKVDNKFLKGKRMVHGHTPISKAEIKKQMNSQIIDIDAGCVYNNHDDLGRLCALDLTNWKLYFKKNKES